MISKLFDWTPRDIAYWEKLRQKGLRSFISWYGVLVSGSLLFILSSIVTIYTWLVQSHKSGLTAASWVALLGQLIFTAVVCLVFGILNSLVTWVVEERLYRKYKARSEYKPH
jgi:hypothetical protein